MERAYYVNIGNIIEEKISMYIKEKKNNWHNILFNFSKLNIIHELN